MSNEAQGFVTGHVLVKNGGLSTPDRMILLLIASTADPHGESSFPGLEYLAELSGASVRTVQRSLDALMAHGLIEDTGERRGRTGRVVVWRMLLPAGTVRAAWPKHFQWRQDVTIPAEVSGMPTAASGSESPAGNHATVTGLERGNGDIGDVESGHPRQVPLIWNPSGNPKTDSSLRSESAPEGANQLAVLEMPSDPLRQRFTLAGYVEHSPWIFTKDGQRRDLLWEAFREVVGFDDADVTKNARGSIGELLKQLRSVGASPREVLRRGSRFAAAKGRRPKAGEFVSKWAEYGDAAEDRFSAARPIAVEHAAQMERVLGVTG